jgi:L-iditol 2-dehydrogenase
MKALFLDAPGKLRLGEFPEADSSDKLRLRVQAVTVCGSDLHYFKEGAIGSSIALEPHILGHEFSAIVDDDRGEAHGLPRGTLVAVDPNEACGQRDGPCEWCERGETNLCPNVKFAGSAPIHGALREVYHTKPGALFKVPAGLDATDAAMLEPLGVAIHAVDHAKIRLGSSVAIVGVGAIGLLILQLVRLVGAGEVHVLEPLEDRRRLALKLGADSVHETAESLVKHTRGRGVDTVLEATDTPEGPGAACAVARIGGKVVLVGIPDGDQFTLTASIVRRKGLTIKLSRRMGHVYPRAIQLVAQKRIDLKAIATHHFTLEHAAKAFELQAKRGDGVIKSVIHLED